MEPDRDLLRVAIPLRAERTMPAPIGLATAGHGLLFGLLRDFAPRAGEALHAPSAERVEKRQPFTVSPLLEAPAGPLTQVVRAGRRSWLCIGLCSPDMVALWDDRLAPVLRDPPFNQRLHLGPGDPYHAGPACVWDHRREPEPPAEMGSSYWALAQGRPAQRWRITFISPTTFEPGGLARGATLPLPDPLLVLRHLGRVWRTWAPADLRVLADEAAVEELACSTQLERSNVTVAESWLPPEVLRWAFTGEVVLAYRGRGESPAVRAGRLQVLHALLGLPPYCGIGIQTGRGMGVIAVTPLPD